MFESGMFHGEDVVKDVCRHVEKMSYQGIKDVSFMKKRTELMAAGYTILESFVDLLPFR